jgi:Leucine-rich repeat (LRR) protein
VHGAHRHLDVSGNSLSRLRPGPYLSGLTSLDLGSNEFTCVPPQLAGCRHLETLSLLDNPMRGLDAAGLALLPRLACLREVIFTDLAI